MNRCINILLFVLGIIGFYSTAFAQIGIQCNTTVKCVCESQNHVRVVPCPADFSNAAIDCTKEGIPQGTCAVNCGQETAAFCEEIPIECKSNEKADCMVTLPVMVGTSTSGCPDGATVCSGQCVDTDSDNANCGECGNSCATAETCVSAVCEPSGCSSPLSSCPGVGCVDLGSDENNCGACGHVCAAGETCVPVAGIGECKKNNGISCVQDSECLSNFCADSVCCNTPCDGTCESCSLPGILGECTIDDNCPQCPAGQINCFGQCINILNNPLNCGACGHVCQCECLGGACIDPPPGGFCP